MKKGFALFREKLRGWWQNADGETLCPSCWDRYLAQFFPGRDEKDRLVKQWVQDDSCLTKELLQKIDSKTQKYMGFKTTDGWFALCEKCGKSVLVPFSPGETY